MATICQPATASKASKKVLAIATSEPTLDSNERIHVSELTLRRPTLDDVFLALTGHAAERAEEEDGAEAEPDGRSGRRAGRGAR